MMVKLSYLMHMIENIRAYVDSSTANDTFS